MRFLLIPLAWAIGCATEASTADPATHQPDLPEPAFAAETPRLTVELSTDASDAARALPATDAVLFLLPGDARSNEVATWFRAFAAAAEGRMSVRVVDAAVEPGLARALDVVDNGEIVLERGDALRRLEIAGADPSTLEAAVLDRLASLDVGPRRLIVVTGHGETRVPALEDTIASDWDATVIVSDGIPDGVGHEALLLVNTPTTPWSTAELDRLDAWTDTGGSGLLLIGEDNPATRGLLTSAGLRLGPSVPEPPEEPRSMMCGNGWMEAVIAERRNERRPGHVDVGRRGDARVLLAEDPADWRRIAAPSGVGDDGAYALATPATRAEGPWELVVATSARATATPLLDPRLSLVIDRLFPGRTPREERLSLARALREDVVDRPPIELVSADFRRLTWTTAGVAMHCESPTSGAELRCIESSETPTLGSSPGAPEAVFATRELDVRGVDLSVLGFDPPRGTLTIDDRTIRFGDEVRGGRYVETEGRVFVAPGAWQVARHLSIWPRGVNARDEVLDVVRGR
jgi:hypothetical protein